MLKDGVNRGTTLLGACAPTLPPPRMLQHGRGRVPITGDSAGQPFCQMFWHSAATRAAWAATVGRGSAPACLARLAPPLARCAPGRARTGSHRRRFAITGECSTPAHACQSDQRRGIKIATQTVSFCTASCERSFIAASHANAAAIAPGVRTMPVDAAAIHAMIEGEKTSRPSSLLH